MTSFALGLILTAALIHATWNLLAKRAGGGRTFVWMFTTLSSLLLIPVALWMIIYQGHAITGMGTLFIVGTAGIHLFYFLFLQAAYRAGDLSYVYPLARGIGPTLAIVGAVVILHERPSPLVVTGLLLVVSGVGLLTVRGSSGTGEETSSFRATLFGVTTGVLIAIYTVWDKYAVHQLGVPPLVLEAFAGLGISLMLAPHAVSRWSEVRAIWRKSRREVVGVALLAPLSYILVLTAMSFTDLSYVAPAREISILFATLLGTRFLGEGQTKRRLFAAVSMVGGVIALALD